MVLSGVLIAVLVAGVIAGIQSLPLVGLTHEMGEFLGIGSALRLVRA